MTILINRVEDLQIKLLGKKVGAVFTMGALHDGHASLMQTCREQIGPNGLFGVGINSAKCVTSSA